MGEHEGSNAASLYLNIKKNILWPDFEYEASDCAGERKHRS